MPFRTDASAAKAAGASTRRKTAPERRTTFSIGLLRELERRGQLGRAPAQVEAAAAGRGRQRDGERLDGARERRLRHGDALDILRRVVLRPPLARLGVRPAQGL